MSGVTIGSTEPGNSHRLLESTEARGTLIHSPLNYERREIRLLTLLSAKDENEDIQLRLQPTDLNEKPAFEALSYCWGEEKDKRSVILNGQTFWVTQNLQVALRNLRKPQEDLQMWVDAICINQKDPVEVEHQLRLMKDIYQDASNVVIWLGEADKSTNTALDLIRRAAKCLRKETGSIPKYADNAIGEEFSDERNKERGFPSITDSESWLPLANLFAREWFSRCWIIQESALATSATVRLGELSVDWSILCAATTFFSRKLYAAREQTIFKDFHKVNLVCQNSKVGLELQDWEPQPLMHLLTAAFDVNATCYKDRIYALLGLTDEETLEYFFPDDMEMQQFFPGYAETTMRQLCTYTSQFLLNDNWIGWGYPLRALAWTKHYPIDKRAQVEREAADGGLMPSWVARWHEEMPAQKRMYVISEQPYATKFRAGGRRYPIINFAKPYELTLKGFIFCPVTRATDFSRSSPLPYYRYWDLIVEIRSFVEHVPSYPTGQNIDEVLALTLTLADKRNDGREGDTYQDIDFQHLCVSVYEQTVRTLQSAKLFEYVQRLQTEWGVEYQRLKGLVGDHVKSPMFFKDLLRGCRGRKFFATSTGHLGIGDITTKPEDLICVLLGGRTPFVIRPADGGYHFVGECYLHGIMEGEALKGRQKSALITLV